MGVRDLPLWDMIFLGAWRMGLGCSGYRFGPFLNDRMVYRLRPFLNNRMVNRLGPFLSEAPPPTPHPQQKKTLQDLGWQGEGSSGSIQLSVYATLQLV